MQNILSMMASIVTAFAVPLFMVFAWQGLTLLQQHGYRTTYAAALLRAVGAGQQAAAARNLSIFEPGGRIVATEAAVGYLMSTVKDSAEGLGIVSLADHALRINSQIGVLAATAEAQAQAATQPLLDPSVQARISTQVDNGIRAVMAAAEKK